MIIVTGGAGLIGSALIWAMNRRGLDDILVVDHLGISDKWTNLRALRFNDYLEKDRFREAFAAGRFADETTAIIHLGACSSTTETDASYLIDNNYTYSRELAFFARTHGIRFIYASSAATYGDGALGYSDDHAMIDQLRPLNGYGFSKQLFDQWVMRNNLIDHVVGLKFSNVFGPNEYHKGEMRSVVKRAHEQICSDGVVRLFKSYRDDYASGEQVRDFVYVKDAVDMILFMLEQPTVNGIYNVGSGTARTWNDLAKAVFAALDLPPKIEYIDMPPDLIKRYQYYTCLPMDKMTAAGFNGSSISLEDSVRDYVVNYLEPSAYLDPADANEPNSLAQRT